MKIYLINLDRAGDRRKYMMDELSRLVPDVPVVRAMCIDIKTPGWTTPTSVRAGHWRSDRWSLGPSDIEIFRSHIDCWEKIAASGELGVVLEDDLIFSDSFTSALRELEVANVKGIIRLDGIGHPLILEKSTVDLNGFTLSRTGSPTASAAAYVLDPQTAAYLATDARIERTVDDYLFDPSPSDRGARGHGLPILQLEPVVTIQAQFGHFTEPGRETPPFLVATKRVDVHKRKSRIYLGPLVYRMRKEFLRMVYRRRLAKRIQRFVSNGGRWAVVELRHELSWD